MTKWEELKNKISDDYNVYSSVLVNKMNFPAVIFTPSSQVPDVELASYKNRILEYKWSLIILDAIKNYDNIEECMDEMWSLAETIPNLLEIKIMESLPFGHVQENKELFAIELKCKSKIK
jgi:hypothetical protein